MTDKKPTVDDLKRWARENEPAAKAVLMARVHAEMERKRVDAYIAPLFAARTFEVRKEWRERGRPVTITAQGDLYLTEDNDPLVAE